jgi:hypothetical protein
MSSRSGILLISLFLLALQSCGLLRHTAGNRHSIGTEALKSLAADSMPKAAAHFIGPINEPEVERLKEEKEMADKRKMEKQKLQQNLDSLYHTPFTFKTLSAKAKVNYQEKDNEKEFTAHIRMVKDSAIWVSITALGGMVQVARILVTQDSLKMINYIDKEVMLISLEQAGRLLPIPADYAMLQNFILGQNLIKRGLISDVADTAGNWIVEVSEQNYQQQIAYHKLDSTMLYSTLRTQDPSGPQGIIQYTNYLLSPERKFSMNRIVQIQNAGFIYVLNMDFTTADFNYAIDLPFNPPRNYSVNPRK